MFRSRYQEESTNTSDVDQGHFDSNSKDDITRTMATTTLVPSQISYLTSYRLVICVDCQTAVRPGNRGERHWRQIHQLGGRPLKALLSYVSTLDCRDPNEIELPPRGVRAIPELGTPFAGFSCPDCAFLTTNKKKWQSHASQTGHRGSGRAAQYAVRL